jgi:hypothetical protein
MNPTIADCFSRSAIDPSTIAVANNKITFSSGTQIVNGRLPSEQSQSCIIASRFPQPGYADCT